MSCFFWTRTSHRSGAGGPAPPMLVAVAGTSSFKTLRWREPDSNSPSHVSGGRFIWC